MNSLDMSNNRIGIDQYGDIPRQRIPLSIYRFRSGAWITLLPAETAAAALMTFSCFQGKDLLSFVATQRPDALACSAGFISFGRLETRVHVLGTMS